MQDDLCHKTFRHAAGFGKRMEFWIIGEMLLRNLDVYIPLVDDRGVDAIIRRDNGTFAEVQIKARSAEVVMKDAALFAGITHNTAIEDYWFVFYSARIGKHGTGTTWILSSSEFIKESAQNKTGKHAGKRSIWFNGTKTSKETGQPYEYPKERYNRYICSDFSRIMKNES